MAAQSENSMAVAGSDQCKTAWFVLRAISGKEGKVKEILDAAIRNTDLGKHLLQVLIPTEKVVINRNGKKVVQERNLYSGYVFIECVLTPVVTVVRGGEKGKGVKVVGSGEEASLNPFTSRNVRYILAGEAVDTLRNTTNVIDFLRGRSKTSDPQMLKREDVERMLGFADDHSEPGVDKSEVYAVGDSLKATDGPFSGFAGVVKEVNEERGVVTIEVKIFGRPTDVTLAFSQVERV